MSGSSSGVSALEYIKKTNKCTILLHAGHQYITKSKYKNGSVIWECVKRKKYKCSGSITIKENQIIKQKYHNNCIPDFAQNEIMTKINKLKETVSNLEAPAVPTAYNMAVSSLKDSGIDIIKTFPPLKTIKTTLYKYRNAALGVDKTEFKTLEEVKVPPVYQKFMLADYNDNGIRIVAFCSETARQHMKTAKHFLGDGTFWICTDLFQQLYTIHADLGSTDSHVNIVPLVYILMSHKNEEAYKIVFSIIKSQLPYWLPETYKCDFEKAAMNGMRFTFENIVITGCYFHFTQAVWKKGKQLGLTMDKITKRQVALSAVLPLLPQEKIMQGWFYIASQSPDDDKSKEFRKYMLNQWLKKNFSKIWCAFSQQHRTTNLLEAWHKKIKKRVMKKNPRLIILLAALSEDASFYEIRALQACNDQQGISERTLKSINRDAFIQECQMELISGQITIGHFLEKLR